MWGLEKMILGDRREVGRKLNVDFLDKIMYDLKRVQEKQAVASQRFGLEAEMKVPTIITYWFSRVLVPVFLGVLVTACGSTSQPPTGTTILPERSESMPSPPPNTPTPFAPNTLPVLTGPPGPGTTTPQQETGVTSAPATISPVPQGETQESPSDTPTLLGSIQGNVIQSSSSGSSPVSGAKITVASRPELVTETNADGFYALTDLQPGEYTLKASTSAAESSFQAVQVVAGETTPLDFTLMAGLPTATLTPASRGGIQGQVTVRSLDGVDQPAKGAAVEVAGWPSLATTADQDGRYTIVDLQPGEYYLIARTTDTLSSYVPVQVAAGVIEVANFLLLKIIPGPPLTIQTKVSVQLNGQPVAEAYVWIEGKKEVFLTNNNGVTSFTYRFNDSRPVIAVFSDRWGFAQVPTNGNVNIELAQQGMPPPLPEDYEIITPTPGVPVPIPGFPLKTQPPVIAPRNVLPSATPTVPLLMLPLITAKP
jgi:hypothetical protein